MICFALVSDCEDENLYNLQEEKNLGGYNWLNITQDEIMDTIESPVNKKIAAAVTGWAGDFL